MDNNFKSIIYKRIQKTGKALEKNNMVFYYAETKQDAKNIVSSLISENDLVATGGSMSLEECGIMDMLKSGKYNFLDRDKYPVEQKRDVYIKSFSADTYLCSSNAITENGELYNVDGNSNRVACISFGPKQVIMVVGYNKIVPNITSAIERVKKISAPANAVRLNCDTYCNKMGECVSLNKDNSSMCDGCNSNDRICCSYVVTSKQRHKDRIKVIIVGEELGY